MTRSQLNEMCRILIGVMGLAALLYGLWQGPFVGKWSEGTFWVALSISAEFTVRNLWGND